jgi:hypothetical protein
MRATWTHISHVQVAPLPLLGSLQPPQISEKMFKT